MEENTPQENNSPARGKTSKQAKGQPKHDIFQDPALAQVPLNDPIYLFVATWWRQLGLVVVAALIITYAYGVFNETYDLSMKSAADLYARVRTEYTGLAALKTERETLKIEISDAASGKKPEAEKKDAKAPDKKTEEADKAKKAKENQDRLTELDKQITQGQEGVEQLLTALSNSKEPYSSIAALYRALLKRDQDAVVFKGAVGTLGDWHGDSDKAMFAELGAVAVARSLIDNDATLAEGRSMLKDLAQHGTVTSFSAAAALADISGNKTDCADALTTLQSLAQRAPQYSDLLEDRIKRLEACAA